MLENMSIEQFYLLYKVGEVCKALACFSVFVGGLAVLGLIVYFSQVEGKKKAPDDTNEKYVNHLSLTTSISFFVLVLMTIGHVLAPTFGEVKAFAVLKISKEAVNSEAAQRLIDTALRRLEAEEEGGHDGE